MIDVKLIKKPKGGSAGSGGTRYVPGTADESRHALKADESLRSGRADFADRAEYSDRSGHASRSSYSDVAEDLVEDSPVFGKFLSRLVNDAAQGVITFAKGILFGDGSHGITEDGDASLRDIRMQSTQSEGYSGTDTITDKGFKVWEDSEGKSHLITDYFTARVKAFFASLEIRKIEHSAGNRIESPAGNTLALVKKFNADDEEIKDKWHARRYGFGLSWGYKLVHVAGQFFGVWKEDETAEVAYYRCYWTADDKEAKKAVENNWKVGDQAYCQTFNLRVPQGSGFASNKYYWRLVVGTGYETIEGVEYAYIDLSNEETLYLEASKIDTPIDAQVDSGLIACSGYDSGSDAPEAGDDVACLGNQVSWSTRGGAKQTITYDPHPDTSGITVPCVKMYAGINSFSALDNFRFKKESPSGIYVHSDKFQIVSAAGTGASSPIYCQRGTYSATETYGKNDIVQYHGASWLYINDTPSSGHAPAEGEYWTAFAQRGMATPYIQLNCSNVIVSADSEGRISSNAAIVVKPTKIELYVDGNKIPVSAWNLPSSYVFYYNRTQYFNQSGLQSGINIGSFTASADYVTINWQYYPIVSGQTIINPVIDSTSFAFHIVFTYNGETYVAETSIPLTVQRPGASGANGANGLNSATVFLYQRSSSVPSKPSSTLTYTFSSGLMSGTLGNWTQIIPTSNGNPCYVIQATAVATTSTDTIASSEWSSPTVLVEDGEDGASGAAGYNTATVYLYQRASSTPQTPTSTLTYTFATKSLSGTLGNWSQTIPSGTNPLYVTAATAYSNTATDTIASNEWSAAVILVQNGTNGNSVMAEYSATGAANSWHSTFQNGDLYVHYSYDGGSTWTTAIRFVGKSIEFEKGIRHFASYNDLWNYLVAKQASYTDSDFGYYLTDTDDGSTPEACLWYFYTQSSDPRDLQYVSLPQSGEVNYFTSYDGHLWNAEDGDTAWHDLGVIQGADGADGISIILDPATVIFNQAETSPYGIDTIGFSATVRVWQGATPLSGNFIPQNGVSGTNCQASFSGNTVYINSINYTTDANNQKHYYSSGKVDVTVVVNNQAVVLTLNWAANLLGEWKLNVVNDTMSAVSSMPVTYYDADGDLQIAAFSTAIQQSSQGVSLCAKKNDVEAAGIHLNGQNSTINLVAGKVNFIDPNGGVDTKIWIDPATGTLHAADGDFQGTLNAKSYLTRYADLTRYCYNSPGASYSDRFFIPGFHTTMYDANDNALNIAGFWCFRVGEVGMEIFLPTKFSEVDPNNPTHIFDGIDLTGQRIVLYNPYIAYRSASHATIIHAGEVYSDGTVYNLQTDVIRGVGLPVHSSDPVLMDQYDPVYGISFVDGLVELQCLPSDGIYTQYEWCVVNLGTNVYKLYGRN
ncbi:MAG: hypothetical protein IKZ61_11885 [Prevotella sp.]|nr:hypothetical protein [Prevotella sp.]